MRNGATWDKFEPRANVQENKIFKKLNFKFCLSLKSVPGEPPFPNTHNPKSYFLYVKIFCLRIARKTISYMLKYFLNFVVG